MGCAALRKERVLLMIGLLAASSALHAEERRPARGERLALTGADDALTNTATGVTTGVLGGVK